MGLLKRGSEWLGGLFEETESRTVTYCRGLAQVEIRATPGLTDLAIVDVGGMTATSFHASDYIFPATALDFGTGAVEPALGDRIVDQGRTYEVLDIPGAKHFRYSDPDRTTLRVHTKLIETQGCDMAELVDIAEAVKTALAAAVEAEQFSREFTPQRIINPHRELTECTSLLVDIIGRKENSVRVDRGGTLQETFEIDIAVRKQLDSLSDTTDHDGLVSLVKEIKTFFFTNPLPGRRERLSEANTDSTTPAEWWGASVPQQGLFFSIVTLVFSGMRSPG